MKYSTNTVLILPLLFDIQLSLLRIMHINELRASNFGEYCTDSLFFVTFCFFFIEWMWFIFRSKVMKANSAYPFWRAFITRISNNKKETTTALGWLLIVSLIWACIPWGADFLTEKSVVHFGFYLTLSLLLNFYWAALFGFWHLFLAPRLSALLQTKQSHLSQ